MRRTRLFGVLDAARERPVIWIGAPAGSGKSTLIASYAASRELPCLWYGVDGRDADPGALFYYLGQGADRHPASGMPALPTLTSDHPAGTLGFARRFFEALFQRIDRGLVVFDDCQVLPVTDRFYDLVREGCEVVPKDVCLVLISRKGPPPMLARLLASSRVTVLGWDDLRFSPDETRDFARARSRKLGIELGEDELSRLDSEFGGWAAGVVLALECTRIERRPDRRALSTASQQLFDYFASEVLGAAVAELRDFLLRSAFLPMMTAATLDHLFGAEGTSRLLARVKADNFFVTEHGSAPPAYRYHPLFRDFLLARARDEWTRAELGDVQRKAAGALAASGETESALELFLAASDRDSAARLVVERAPALMQSGRARTVCDWIERIGTDRLASDPWLAFWAGTANLVTRPERAVEYCERAFYAFSEADDRGAFWLSWRALAQAYQLEGNDFRRLKPLVERALSTDARQSFGSPELEAGILRSAVIAMMAYAPESPELENLARRALSQPDGRDPEELVLAILFHGFRGELSELSEIVSRWERRSAREELAPAIRNTMYLPKVFGALFSGEFAKAQALIREALEHAERFGFFAWNAALLVYSAYGHVALGEASALAVVVDEMNDIAEGGTLRAVMNAKFGMGFEALLTGDLARAGRHMTDVVALSERSGSPFATCVHQLGLVEVLTLRGELDQAHRELQRVRSVVDPMSQILAQSARLCAAQIALMSGNAPLADELLAEAMAMGAAGGFIPLPAPTRITLARLAGRAQARGIEDAYVNELVRKFELSVVEAAPSAEPAPTRTLERPHHVPSEFSRTLRSALRRFHETRRLAENPLLRAMLVASCAGPEATVDQRLSTLRNLLRDSVQELAQTSRTEPCHRALFHTYIDPAPTQLLAAEAARMSFGTYRRHLTAGLDELAMSFWLREQSLRKQPGS
jgi:ATP/maltotriose-dependent transcriptional regulator MalT